MILTTSYRAIEVGELKVNETGISETILKIILLSEVSSAKTCFH